MPTVNEKDLKQLAIDIVENKVFGTWQMSEADARNHLRVVFMALLGVDDDDRKKYKEENIVHFYEYYDKAGPRSVNGMPCFFSMCLISKDDWEKVIKYSKEYEVRVKSFLDKDEKKEPEGPTLFDKENNEDNQRD